MSTQVLVVRTVQGELREQILHVGARHDAERGGRAGRAADGLPFPAGPARARGGRVEPRERPQVPARGEAARCAPRERARD